MRSRRAAATARRTADLVLGVVAPTFERLRQQGKIRFGGITAVGEIAAIRRVAEARAIGSAQVVFNLLNPSSGAVVAAGYPGQNFEELLKLNADCGIGSIAIRILGGGALSGTAARQPNASPAPARSDHRSRSMVISRQAQVAPLAADGAVTSLTELAIRYAITEPNVGTALIGLASQADLETAIGSVEKGPLSREVIARVAAIQATLAPSS